MRFFWYFFWGVLGLCAGWVAFVFLLVFFFALFVVPK